LRADATNGAHNLGYNILLALSGFEVVYDPPDRRKHKADGLATDVRFALLPELTLRILRIGIGFVPDLTQLLLR
jgi:hypothetical protein